MKKYFFLLLVSIFGFTGNANAALYPEVSCSTYGTDANSCTQCFDAGFKYTKESFAPYDNFYSSTTNDVLYFKDENPITHEWKTLNPTTTWITGFNLLRYPDAFVWKKTTSDNREVHIFPKSTSERFLETTPGQGIWLDSVAMGTDRNKAAYRLKINANYRLSFGPGIAGRGPLTSHSECFFYKPSWCGDGVLETGKGEICDPNDASHTGWGNGGCSQDMCKPIDAPTCNGIVVTPKTGTRPVTSSVTCTGYKVNTFKIDCGNGTSFTAPGTGNGTESVTKSCTYTDAGNYNVSCTVNGTINPNICKSVVSVNGTTPLIIIDKRDANPLPNDKDGNVGNDTQTVDKGTKAVFKITVTNNGTEPLKEIKLTDAVEPSCGGNVTLPFVFPSTWSNYLTTGNNDNKFDPGESFSFTCEKSNTLTNYTNTAGVTGVGIYSNTTVGDDDPTQVKVLNPTTTPSIIVDKRDANPLPNDKDGVVGNDTQTVGTGEKAVFKIRVTNNGTEDLRNIVLTDAVAPVCGGSVTLPSTKPSTWSNFVVSGSGSHTDTLLQPGEYFEYTCEKPNTTANYTNTAQVDAIGNISNTPVTDNDPTDIKVQPISGTYDLALIKKIKNPQTSYKLGDNVTYEITVYNQGTINASTIEVSDYIPTGMTLVSTDWTLSGTTAKKSIGAIAAGASKVVEITLKINVATGKLINWAEISADDGNDIDSTPDTDNANDCHGGKPRTDIDPASDDRVDGKGDTNKNGVCDAGEDEDDHDPAQLTVGTTPSIIVDKRDGNASDRDGNIGNDVQFVNTGSGAVFKIRVTNNGTESLKDIKLTDAVAPVCGGSVTLPSTFPSTWSNIVKGGSGSLTDAILEPGEYFEYTCEKSNTTGNYTNTILVEGTGVDSGTKVTDDDPTDVKIYTGPTIDIDKRDANPSDLDAHIGDDTQTVTSGAAALFKIRVTNTGVESVKDIILNDAIEASCGGSVTLPSTFPSTWSNIVKGGSGSLTDAILEPGEYFEYTCQKTNTTGNYTNTAGVEATGITSGTKVTDSDPTQVFVYTGGGSSSSSSGGASCIQLIATNKSTSSGTLATDVTCIGNNSIDKIGIDCNNDGTFEKIATGADITKDNTLQTTRTSYTCNYSSDIKVTPQIVCKVADGVNDPLTITSNACRTAVTLGSSSGGSSSSSSGGGESCGDGVVQSGRGEQCERSIDPATNKLGAFPSFCTSSCKIKIDPNVKCTSTNNGINGAKCLLTFPNGGNLRIEPGESVLIGNMMNPFDYVITGQKPYIYNDSPYDLKFDELCVKQTKGNTLQGNTVCTPIGMIYPGQKVSFATMPIFKGIVSKIAAGSSYGDNTLVTTIKQDGQILDWAYFASKLNVRVAKPSVVTTGGGTSVIKNTSSLSNVKDVATNNSGFEVTNLKATDNNNFVGTSVSNLSSYAKDTINTVTKAQVENSLDLSKSTSTVSKSTTGSTPISSLVNLGTSYNYNGMDNVFYVKGQDVKISSLASTSTFKGPRTYIIEDANLIIDGDITYADNIAFVVKGGNITLGSDVKTLNGIYITIPKSGVGGNINQASETSNVLTVNGSLYGKIDDLLNKRTYVRNNTSGQIDVGTVVSFASSLFQKPAPLVGEFIDQYTKAAKIAK